MCRQSVTVCLVKPPSRQHASGGSLAERLRGLPDPRHRRGRRHPFVSVLLVAASAVLAGARSYAAIGQWGVPVVIAEKTTDTADLHGCVWLVDQPSCPTGSALALSRCLRSSR